MKKKVSTLEKEDLLKNFEKSKLNQSEFSRVHGLNKKTLSRWINESRGKKEEEFFPNNDLKPLFKPVFIRDEEGCNVKKGEDKSQEEPCLTLKVKGFSLDIPILLKESGSLKDIIQLLHGL